MRKITFATLTASFFVFNGYSQDVAQNSSNYTSFTGQREQVTPELDALTAKEFKAHPEFGVLPFNAPCTDCFELLQKRDASHRYFVKEGSNGKEFYAQSSYGDLNFKDENGNFRTIDTRLKPESSAGVFKAKYQPFPVTINLPGRFTSILNAGKELLVNRDVTIYIKHKDGSISSLGQPSWSDYTAGDNGVVVRNFYNGIDLLFEVHEGKIESSYRLNKPLPLGDGWLVVHDNVQLPDGFVYDYSYSEKKEGNFYEGALCINDNSGKRYFIVGNPSAYDLNGGSDNRIGLRYQTNSMGNYDLYVPTDWMNDAKRSYPLIIDPLVSATSTLPQVAITGSGYNAVCFTGGCSYNLVVAVPPACEITGLHYSFSYLTSYPCTLRDGGWDISYGACRTPVNSCTFGLIGACILQNLNCFGDFKSCLPPPQCAAGNLNCSLTFYRCAEPGAGCGFSCINADSPWDMTVEGRTLEVTANNAKICGGNTATITADAKWGVPPYGFLWNNSAGSITQSISESPNVTTVYTVTVTDQCSPPDATATSTVTVVPSPVADFSFKPQSSDDDLTVSFTDLSTGATSWLWNFGDQSTGTLQNPDHTYHNAGIYTVTLTAMTVDGCTESKTYNVEVSNTFFYYVPTSFTPNGDGVNDYFAPIGTHDLIYEMTIYNRWGEEIFKTSDNSLPWSGEVISSDKMAATGVYVYKIKFKNPSYTDKMLVGSVTVMR